MKKFFFLSTMVFFCACHNSTSKTSTADSLNHAASVDTMNVKDTTSYERNNATGADSIKR
jgi:hypothetical protein